MTMQVIGIEEVDRILNEVSPRHARNLMRNTIHGVASEINRQARKNAPKDTGTLKKALKAKRKKSHPNQPISEVVVEHGGGVRHDAFYWRFVEHGTVNRAATPFIKPAEEAVRANLAQIIREQFGKKLESALKREARKQAKR